jgi:hypothetical protein
MMAPFFCGLCFASKWHMYYVTNGCQEHGVMNFYAQFFLQVNPLNKHVSKLNFYVWSFHKLIFQANTYQSSIANSQTPHNNKVFIVWWMFLFFSMKFFFNFCPVTLKTPSLVHAFVIYHYRTKPKFSWSQHWLIIKLLYISCFFVIHLLNRLNFLSIFVAYKAFFYKILKKHDGDASLEW